MGQAPAKHPVNLFFDRRCGRLVILVEKEVGLEEFLRLHVIHEQIPTQAGCFGFATVLLGD